MSNLALKGMTLISTAAIVLDVIALTTTWWRSTTDHIPIIVRLGLFQKCIFGKCKMGEFDATERVAVTFLISTGFFLVGAIFLAFQTILKKSESAKKAGMLNIIGVVCALVAVGTYGGLHYSATTRQGKKVFDFGYSFRVACAIAPLCGISAILGFVGA